jgi:protein-L-isoaspartate(D-aspartate) O-methyltransferase
VLEIGTGSGYAAAVASLLTASVHSVERHAVLADEAARRLAELGFARVRVRTGDGTRGWPEAAPFDAIIVTAAPDHIPAALVAQLKPGGRLVIPVGTLFQELMVVQKQADGSTINEQIVPVRFVPLTRDAD